MKIRCFTTLIKSCCCFQKHVDFKQGVKKVLIVDSDVALRTGTLVEASGWASQVCDQIKTWTISKLFSQHEKYLSV